MSKMKRVIFEEFENEASFNEFQDVIITLKPKKSHGQDGIINEYFIRFKVSIIPLVKTIFNDMFQQIISHIYCAIFLVHKSIKKKVELLILPIIK